MFLLAVGDIISAFLLARDLLSQYIYNIPEAILLFFAGYLVIKGLIFIRDIGSLLDIVSGALLAASAFAAIPTPFLVIFALILGIKGLMTFFAKI